jgi:hypothetical protein
MSEFSRDIIVEGIGSYLINDDKPYHRVMLTNKFWHSSLRLDIGLIAQYMQEFSFIYPRELVRSNLLSLKAEDVYPFVTACRNIIPVAKKDEADFYQLENYFCELLNKKNQDNVLIQLMLSLLHRHRYYHYLDRRDETHANQSKHYSQVFAEKIKDKCANAWIILADFHFADSIDGALAYFKEAMADFGTNKILAKIKTSRMFFYLKFVLNPVILFDLLKVFSLEELLEFNLVTYKAICQQRDFLDVAHLRNIKNLYAEQHIPLAVLNSVDPKKVGLLFDSEKMKIYYRDGCLCLPKNLKDEITGKIYRPSVVINEPNYVYVRTLAPVAREDMFQIKQVGKFKFIGDEQVMTYLTFLDGAKIIRSNTQTVMGLSFAKKREIFCREGRLFFPVDLEDSIEVETCPRKRPDKEKKHEDITKYDKPEDATPAAKRKKMGEEEAIAATGNSNRNSFFQAEANVRDDENGNAENEGDYTMSEPQEGPR